MKKYIIAFILGILVGTFIWESPHYYDSYYYVWQLGETPKPVICHGWGNYLQKGGNWTCEIETTWREITNNCSTDKYGLINKDTTVKNYIFYKLRCED